ncbi:MAG TPA: hypothetical protein VGP51_08595 [Nocardioidaceae bacterium]|jgi:hypothetical protein|nr:hypothetical protein [Actinomycetota bacterium]HEV8056531.1 hypothetical protein [Nocardioidaceae bacterium]
MPSTPLLVPPVLAEVEATEAAADPLVLGVIAFVLLAALLLGLLMFGKGRPHS